MYIVTVVNGILRANASKSAVMVFSKNAVNGCWKWGEHCLFKVSSYSIIYTKELIFLVVEPGICIIIKKVLDNGRKKVNQSQKVISNRNINYECTQTVDIVCN